MSSDFISFEKFLERKSQLHGKDTQQAFQNLTGSSIYDFRIILSTFSRNHQKRGKKFHKLFFVLYDSSKRVKIVGKRWTDLRHFVIVTRKQFPFPTLSSYSFLWLERLIWHKLNTKYIGFLLKKRGYRCCW